MPVIIAVQALLSRCDLSTVWKIKGAEGFGNFWAGMPMMTGGAEVRLTLATPWTQLSNMNLSHCGLSSLPAIIGEIWSLRILRVSYNKLVALPAELQALEALEILAADHNLLTAIPGG
jgi:Leucine-rich repeat (LRR) protein